MFVCSCLSTSNMSQTIRRGQISLNPSASNDYIKTSTPRQNDAAVVLNPLASKRKQ
ncbi:hypothetical protein Plhal304r1_c077g0164421 [Plasmopara halstedii]